MWEDTPDREAMAGFFADINTAYFAGRLDSVHWNETLFDTWQMKDTFLSQYLAGIADDGFQDQTTIVFSFGGSLT